MYTYVSTYIPQDALVLQRVFPQSGGCLHATTRAWLAAKITTPPRSAHVDSNVMLQVWLLAQNGHCQYVIE